MLYKYSVGTVNKAVFLYLKALSHDLRAELLIAVQENQGIWDLTSAPWFLRFHRKFCLDFTAELEDTYPSTWTIIWYRIFGIGHLILIFGGRKHAISTPQPHGIDCSLHFECQGRG